MPICVRNDVKMLTKTFLCKSATSLISHKVCVVEWLESCFNESINLFAIHHHVCTTVVKYLHHLNEDLFLSVMWRFTSLVEERSNSHRKGLKEVHLELDKNIKGYSAKRSLLSACGVYSSIVLIRCSRNVQMVQLLSRSPDGTKSGSGTNI